MQFIPLPLPDAFLIEMQPAHDNRGLFVRTWCRERFAEQGLCTQWAQSSLSVNHHRGTLRGLHYQQDPHAEIKLVRCIQGAAWDVIVDLRRDSPTYGRWHAEELDARQARAIYIPRGFAHGFITLQDNTQLDYQISEPYHAAQAGGWHWNSPALAIRWPLEPLIVSARDQTLPEFST